MQMEMIRLDTCRKLRGKERGEKCLKEQKQSVIVNDEFSQGMKVSSGVPQRSVVRVMLVNIFINCVEKETNMK